MKRLVFLFISCIAISGCASSATKSPRSDSGYHRRQSWNESRVRERSSANAGTPVFSMPILWWTW